MRIAKRKKYSSYDIEIDPENITILGRQVLMTRWIKCPGCDGEIGVPDEWADELVKCPNCKASVAIDPEKGIQWRPSKNSFTERSRGCFDSDGTTDSVVVPDGRKKTVPEWFLAAGLLSIIVAAAGFIASAIYGSGAIGGATIIAGVLNPFFFIGAPLGFYWLSHWWDSSCGKSFYCPYCDVRIFRHGLRGDVITCWNCKKKLRKP